MNVIKECRFSFLFSLLISLYYFQFLIYIFQAYSDKTSSQTSAWTVVHGLQNIISVVKNDETQIKFIAVIYVLISVSYHRHIFTTLMWHIAIQVSGTLMNLIDQSKCELFNSKYFILSNMYKITQNTQLIWPFLWEALPHCSLHFPSELYTSLSHCNFNSRLIIISSQTTSFLFTV